MSCLDVTGWAKIAEISKYAKCTVQTSPRMQTQSRKSEVCQTDYETVKVHFKLCN